jgi:hypothetical protein
LSIEIADQDVSGTDVDLDDYAEEVEVIMEQNYYLGLDIVNGSWLTSTTTLVSDDGDQEISAIKLVYTVEYFSEVAPPATPYDDLDTVFVKTEQPPVDWETIPAADIDAEDEIDLT